MIILRFLTINKLRLRIMTNLTLLLLLFALYFQLNIKPLLYSSSSSYCSSTGTVSELYVTSVY